MAEKPKKTLAKVRAELRRDRDTIARAQERIDANLKLGLELGGNAPDLATDAGLTVGRLSQIVGGVRAFRAAAGVAAPKRKSPARPETEDQDPEGEAAAEDHEHIFQSPHSDEKCYGAPGCTLTFREFRAAQVQAEERRPSFTPGAVDRVRQLVHAGGLVSDRWAKPREERRTLFVDVATGKWHTAAGAEGAIPWRAGSAAELLGGVPASTERVLFVGPYRPGVTPALQREHGSAAAAARAWFLAPVPEGWTGSHHLSDDAALIGHWKHTDGRTLDVLHAAAWFGHGDYSARDAAGAWAALRHMLDDVCPGTVLMTTPSTTGRDMWRRMIPEKSKGYPVLSDELRELIRLTSGQGRRELIRSAPVGIGMVTQYDMRIAYGALTWGMPVGAPTMVNRAAWEALDDDGQHKALARRGRWFVRATVPTGWTHIGILPHLSAEGWVWPARPGQTFNSWCSAPELAVAREHGWRVDVIEGFHFTEGKPLNAWRDALMSIYTKADAAPADAGRSPALVKAAVRLMLLGTIGSFHSKARAVTHTAAEGDALPADAQVREVAGRYMWETSGERSEWTERTSHPEWSAEIWGRCRTRLLEAPAVPIGGPNPTSVRTGALHVPPGSVIGLRTDGLTLVGDPEWPDDRQPGRYRLTGRARGAFTWPQSDAAWSELKRTIEGAYETGEMQ